jgi:hypothetical protein
MILDYFDVDIKNNFLKIKNIILIYFQININHNLISK